MKVVSTESKEDFTVYRLSLESLEEQESDSVLLFHFTDWPSHAVPNNGLTSLTVMFQQVMTTKANQQMDSVSNISISLCIIKYNIILCSQ